MKAIAAILLVSFVSLARADDAGSVPDTTDTVQLTAPVPMPDKGAKCLWIYRDTSLPCLVMTPDQAKSVANRLFDQETEISDLRLQKERQGVDWRIWLAGGLIVGVLAGAAAGYAVHSVGR